MGLYRATVHHNGLAPDRLVEIPDEQLEEFAGDIRNGFLVPAPEPDELVPERIVRNRAELAE